MSKRMLRPKPTPPLFEKPFPLSGLTPSFNTPSLVSPDHELSRVFEKSSIAGSKMTPPPVSENVSGTRF